MMLHNKTGVWFIVFKQGNKKKFWIGTSGTSLEHIITSKLSQMHRACYEIKGYCYLPDAIKLVLKEEGYNAIKGVYCVPLEERHDLIDYNKNRDNLKYFISKVLMNNGYEPCTTQHSEWMQRRKNWCFMYMNYVDKFKNKEFVTFKTATNDYNPIKVLDWELDKEQLIIDCLIAEGSINNNDAVTEKVQDIVINVSADKVALEISPELLELLTIESVLEDKTIESIIKERCVSDKAIRIKAALNQK